MTRRVRRFYVDAVLSAETSSLLLSPRETFHLRQVLRHKAGDACEIFNRHGWGAKAVVESVSETEGARLQVKEIFSLKQQSLFLKVAQALPQKGKMDRLVEKAEELGVQELWALETKRSVVKMRGEARARVRERWERIVIEAAKQSGSPILTRVEGPVPFETVVREKLKRSDRAFLFHPDPKGLSFSAFLERIREPEAETLPPAFLFFGPEGGFDEEEVHLAESHGVKKVFLGDSVLRLETAFLGVLSALRFLIP